MTVAELFTFAVVAGLLVMSPGPNGVLIAKTVPTSGRAAGFANILGFSASFYLHGTLSVLGISLILVQSAYAFSIVKYLGAAYLCWIGIKALIDAYKGGQSKVQVAPAKRERTLYRAFAEGFLTNILNPKTSMFYLAAFPQFISPTESGILVSYQLVTIHCLLNAIWFGGIVFLFATLTKAASSGSFQRWLKGVTGVVFIGFGLKLASIRPNL